MKTITREDFIKAVVKAIDRENDELSSREPKLGLMVALMGMSIGQKIENEIFGNEEEIEIVSEKE